MPEHLASFERVGFGKSVSFGWLSDDFGTDGTLGDPTGATAEHGKQKYEAMIATAARSLAEIAVFDPRRPVRDPVTARSRSGARPGDLAGSAS